ncbi:MAG: HD domain-containing protein [Hungatella sp.]
MNQEEVRQMDAFMLECMDDSVHDPLHSYRVLNYALQIAITEDCDMDVVITSALLHDIGRAAEKKNPALCHAEVGSEMARTFLDIHGYSREKADHIADCILTHRFRKNRKPQTIEAKILFDADKLDLTGAAGTARAILFGGQIEEPLYILGEDLLPTVGLATDAPSLFREYHRKLQVLCGKFYTARATEIGLEQQKTMDAYFERLFFEVNQNHRVGKEILEKVVSERHS